MCGIAGAYRFGTVPDDHLAAKVGKMVNCMTHRGPDDSTVATFGNVVMGHNRLKIIDTSDSANQPWSDDSGNALVYNGECYNHRELAAHYREPFSPLQSSCDTEILFKLLKAKGSDAVHELNGMFAFAFWNASDSTLILARDRVGIKPLFYYRDADTFYFASELRALIKILPAACLNRNTLSEYLAYQCARGTETLIEGVKSLPPGSLLRITPEGEMKEQNYYGLDEALDNAAKSEPGQLKAHFLDAVKRRLMSDVPLGAFLSGGIDSSAIVAAMAELGQSDIRTFTLGFEQTALDERRYAHLVAEKYGTDHSEIVLSEAEIIQVIPEAVQSLDQPSGDAVNTWLVSKFTKASGLTVALSGLGGDELFGGYPSALFKSKTDSISFLKYLPTSMRSIVLESLIGSQSARKQKMKRLLAGSFTPQEIVEELRRVLNREALEQLKVSEPVSRKVSEMSGFNGITYHELMAYTIPLLLKDSDQTGMAHSLEIRVPFLDHTFLEYVAGLPEAEKDPQRASYPKSALIEALGDAIPESIYKRPKAGFVLPMNSWMRTQLKEFTAAGLFDSPLRDLLPCEVLEQYWNQFLEQDHPEVMTWSRIWTLSVLGHWLRKEGISI